MSDFVKNELFKKLCCPICMNAVRQEAHGFKCQNSKCAALFPIVNGVPVFLDEKISLFSADTCLQSQNSFLKTSSSQKLKKWLRKLTPSISRNINAKKNYLKLTDLLLKQNEDPKVLILGGGIVGQGLTEILSLGRIHFVETDISLGPRTALICDAHSIPYENGTFDGVIIQAVLEHVVDPYHCVDEIYRVLKEDGLVYAETAFMQQVHGGKCDFTRFTQLGHRRLFRKFDCLADGITGGPGMALAWSLKYFLCSFVKSRHAISVLDTLADFCFFGLKYVDSFLIKKPGAMDAAAGYYFLGRKSLRVLSDKEVAASYRGAALS